MRVTGHERVRPRVYRLEGKAMDEAEWLAFDDPQPMLSFLQSKASARKLRLFAAACCRRMWRAWEVIPSPVEMQAVEMAERFADGQASDEERSAALSSLD